MAVTLSNLTIGHGEKTVLSQLSHRFDEGTTCLFSPSGRGKTTLLHTIAGLIPPLHGKVIRDSDRLSMAFQEDRLLNNLSAFSNIRLVCPERTIGEIEAALTAVGLGSDIYTPVREFSGGMRRRVAVIRAMLFNADIYLLDEPFAGLDADNAESLIDIIKRFGMGKVVIISTHDESLPNKLNAKTLRL